MEEKLQSRREAVCKTVLQNEKQGKERGVI